MSVTKSKTRRRRGPRLLRPGRALAEPLANHLPVDVEILEPPEIETRPVAGRTKGAKRSGPAPGLLEPYMPKCRLCGMPARRGRRVVRCSSCGRLTCQSCLHAGLCRQCYQTGSDEVPTREDEHEVKR